MRVKSEQKFKYDLKSKNVSGFIYQETDEGKITILTVLPNSATIQKAFQFQEFILDLIENSKKNIIIDLSICKFIDSTFLGAMVIAGKKILFENGNLCLVVKNKLITSTFIFTNLEKIFRTFPTISAAIEGIHNS